MIDPEQSTKSGLQASARDLIGELNSEAERTVAQKDKLLLRAVMLLIKMVAWNLVR